MHGSKVYLQLYNPLRDLHRYISGTQAYVMNLSRSKGTLSSSLETQGMQKEDPKNEVAKESNKVVRMWDKYRSKTGFALEAITKRAPIGYP